MFLFMHFHPYNIYISSILVTVAVTKYINMGEKYARAKVAQKEEEEERQKGEENQERERERDINRGEIKIKIHRVSFDNSKIDLILIRKTQQ